MQAEVVTMPIPGSRLRPGIKTRFLHFGSRENVESRSGEVPGGLSFYRRKYS